jgi:hypothetical protein
MPTQMLKWGLVMPEDGDQIRIGLRGDGPRAASNDRVGLAILVHASSPRKNLKR